MTTRNQTRQLLQGVVISAALLLVTAPAALADPQGYRAVLEHRACAVDLGLDPSEAEYDACVRSLDRTLSDTETAQTANKRQPCAEIGLSPGSRAFAQCSADLRATLSNKMNLGAR
jgi:hypothetical protein